MPSKDVRPSPIAGKWYPGKADKLKAQLDRYMADEPVGTYSQLFGLLAPHAGLVYSGPVAGYSFRYLRGMQFDIVVVISPSHHPYPSPMVTTGHAAFSTPLGEIPVATEIVEMLAEKLPIRPVRDDSEHAIEMELPFLQHTLGEFQLVPVAMIDQDFDTAGRLAAVLVEILAGRKVLFVASSDLSHFYDQGTAQGFDQVVLDAVAAYDPEGVIAVENEGRGFACGRGAIAAVMLVARQLGATTATIEHYATSGDVNGDFSRVVGYGAATFHA